MTTPRPPISSTLGLVKITLKINITKVSDAFASFIALTLSDTLNLGVVNEVEVIELIGPLLLPIMVLP